MTHFRTIPLDERARNGCYHGLCDDAGHLHSGRWDNAQQCFAYSNGAPIRAAIVGYNARVPGNPSQMERPRHAG